MLIIVVRCWSVDLDDGDVNGSGCNADGYNYAANWSAADDGVDLICIHCEYNALA